MIGDSRNGCAYWMRAIGADDYLGPKSPEGKATSAMRGYKGGQREAFE